MSIGTPRVEIQWVNGPPSTLSGSSTEFSFDARTTSSDYNANYRVRALIVQNGSVEDEVSQFTQFINTAWTEYQYIVIPEEVDAPDGSYELRIIAEEVFGDSTTLLYEDSVTVDYTTDSGSGGTDDGTSDGGDTRDSALSKVSVQEFSVATDVGIATGSGQINNISTDPIDVVISISPESARGLSQTTIRVDGNSATAFTVDWTFNNEQDITRDFCFDIADANYV